MTINTIDPQDLTNGQRWLRTAAVVRDDGTATPEADYELPDGDLALACDAAVLICDELEQRGEVFVVAYDDQSYRVAVVTPRGWAAAR